MDIEDVAASNPEKFFLFLNQQLNIRLFMVERLPLLWDLRIRKLKNA